MRAVIALLFLCLCDPGHGDCQADCLTCSSILPKHLGFNPAVCLIECERNVSPSFHWNFCQTALTSSISSIDGSVKKRSRTEAEAQFSEQEEQMENDLHLPIALQSFSRITRALGLNEGDQEDKNSRLNDAYDSLKPLLLENEYEPQGREQPGDDDDEEATARIRGYSGVSKRFGGFVKGRHSYRRLMHPGRSFQKRYGGFIGIRKSARKWNNQKRFSEFLKQYLGMSTRATEFDSVSNDLNHLNEV